jgi:glycosyltransferase involved in cell wall biosynthesis
MILLPARNEEGSVASVIDACRREFPSAAIVVVDDASSDRTEYVATGADLVLRTDANLGVGGVLRVGLRLAQRHSVVRLVTVDGDGQHPPTEIPRLLATLEDSKADMVLGNRFHGDHESYDMGLVRRGAIGFIRWIIGRRCSLRLKDPTSGFRAIRNTAYETMLRCVDHQYLGDTAVAYSAMTRSELRIVEQDVTMLPRVHGKQSQSLYQSLVYFVQCVAVLSLRLARK